MEQRGELGARCIALGELGELFLDGARPPGYIGQHVSRWVGGRSVCVPEKLLRVRVRGHAMLGSKDSRRRSYVTPRSAGRSDEGAERETAGGVAGVLHGGTVAIYACPGQDKQ